MTTAIAAAPDFYAGRTTGCTAITPVLAAQPGSIMAGNFRDSANNCYVWLNLNQSDLLTGSEICKVTLHEMGHLNGLAHSQDPNDVMYSPFRSDPIPGPCQAPAAAQTQAVPGTKAKGGKAKASTASVRICPPGTRDADYCQAAASRKATPPKRSRRSDRL